MSIKALICLDTVPKSIREKSKPGVERTFKCYVFLVIMIESFLLSVTISFIIIWWFTGYVWDLFLRFPTLIRWMILCCVLLCQRINVLRLNGNSQDNKKLSNFYNYNSLGTWMAIGMVDVYLFRYPILILDLIIPILLTKTTLLQFLLYILLDIFYIGEYYLSNHILVNCAVYENIRKQKKFNMKKKKMRFQDERIQKISYYSADEIITTFSLDENEMESQTEDDDDYGLDFEKFLSSSS
jgi:hypothetical protein